MRRLHRLPRTLAAAAALAALAGCNSMTNDQGVPASADVWAQQDNFTDANGGYTFAHEATAFGDPTLMQMEIAENTTLAGVADSIPDDSTGTAFLVRLTWGQVQGNPASTTVTDWSGAIHVDHGGFGVLRTVGFEILQRDHLLPRPDRQTLEFVSHTSTRFDGLLLVVRPGDTFGGAGNLSFTSAPFTQSWSYETLRSANLVIPVDDAGNAVAVVGMPLRPRPAADCGQGFVLGAWAHRETAADGPVRGFFRGVWVLDSGRPIGHIRGHFGTNDAGEHVWFGKIIARDGHVLGLARGTYAPNSDPEVAGGTFAGNIVNSEGGPVTGHTEGRYLPGRPHLSPDVPDPRSGDSRWGPAGAAGFLEGTWQIQCP